MLIIVISGIANAMSFVPTVAWLKRWYEGTLFGAVSSSGSCFSEVAENLISRSVAIR